MFDRLKESTGAMIDLGVVLMIGIAFAALMVVAFIIWEIRDQLFELLDAPTGASSAAYNASYAAQDAMRNTSGNITVGFDNAVSLLLVAITIFILAIAISALLMLRGR